MSSRGSQGGGNELNQQQKRDLELGVPGFPFSFFLTLLLTISSRQLWDSPPLWPEAVAARPQDREALSWLGWGSRRVLGFSPALQAASTRVLAGWGVAMNPGRERAPR